MKRLHVRRTNPTLGIILVILAVAVCVPIIFSVITVIKSKDAKAAVSGSYWSAGNIITDSVFFNSGSMTTQDIQAFLNRKVPSCDTYGTQMYSVSMTNAQYAASRGWPGPAYVCLRDYYQVPRSDQNINNLTSNTIPSGAISAAEIIKKAADTYGVNPRALLVTLEKESLSLLNDKWPLPVQYRNAMGYGCPDTAPCDPQYEGFYNQMMNAARQFRLYRDNPSSYRYRAGQNNNIHYNPSKSCGSSNVYIQTQASAGLYNYTPYQPNQAALNNMYGTGDGCSAYGNRNFWRIYIDWFGSTSTNTDYAWVPAGNPSFINSERTIQFTGSEINLQPGQEGYITVSALNAGNQTWTKDIVHLGTAGPNDRSSPLANGTWVSPARIKMQQESVSPGDIATFTFSFKAPSTRGIYYERLSIVADGIKWLNDPGLIFTINVLNQQQVSNSLNTELRSSESITPTKNLLSPDSQSVLKIDNGNVKLISNFNTLWETNTRGPIKGLYMQPDGNLVLYSSSDTPLWNSATSGNPGAFLAMQIDGNMVIYSSTGTALWSTGTVSFPNNLRRVNYSLLNATLYPGQFLLTPDEKYKMVLQYDGNLVVYSSTRPLWASGTSGRAAAQLSMQPDGNLVIYDHAGSAIWTSRTSGTGRSQLSMQPDGNLVIYTPDGRATWSSGTSGQQ